MKITNDSTFHAERKPIKDPKIYELEPEIVCSDDRYTVYMKRLYKEMESLENDQKQFRKMQGYLSGASLQDCLRIQREIEKVLEYYKINCKPIAAQLKFEELNQ